ncbi:MAG: 4-demethylwyosine synthase TYW1 [Thermoplasmata archaeon]|nr:4-demethylwyosine synthase TYW1 [Thermoplasmata archaeon]
MRDDMKRILEKQHYFIVGEHSGVKLCHWMGEKLLRQRSCYKERFYGIQSHRCLQMTPTVSQCTQICLFCWRFQGFNELAIENEDDPIEILDRCIEGQRKLITGYKGDERTERKMWEEACEPNQVAISLSGEPTLYSRLGEFIAECHSRNMTTFVVSNGLQPEALENLDPLPTQLYITVAAPNNEIYKKLCVPLVKDGWGRLKKSLEIMASLDTRTVIRHTLVEDWNIGWEKEYAHLDKLANPLFIEPKGYVFVGYSRERMTMKNMPSYERVKEFGQKLGAEMGYDILDEAPESRVLVLGKDRANLRIDNGIDEGIGGK